MKDEIFRKLISYCWERHRIVLPNAHFGFNECDVFSVTHSDYTYEFEVKISRSDFFADKKKTEKHLRYMNAHSKKETMYGFIPNRFFYVCPDGMIKKEEVPEWAGLITMRKGGAMDFKKNAPLIHKTKATDKLYRQIVEKCYHRYMDKVHRPKINELNKVKK